MHGGTPERERALIEAAWNQFEDLTGRSSAGTRPSGSFSARSRSGLAPDSSRPRAFPGYQVLEQLKRGGQGVVLLAVQESTGRRVAIKTLRHGTAAGAAERARFDREIDLLTRLRHPNVVSVHDRGWTDDGAYFVMDFVAGASLETYLDEVRGEPRQVATIFAKIAEAVSAAHLLGIIHRDLKPSNIRIDERGEPQVLDFGLARLADEDRHAEREITQTGQFIGSLPWASPEQVQGDPDALDVRSDVYSLGVMLYQALTGEFPYPVSGPVPEVIRHISATAPAKPSSKHSRLDNEIETIVLKCLAKEPPRRYQSAGELARDLGRYLRGEAIEAKRESAWYVMRKLASRNRAAVVLSGIALAAVIVGGVTSSILYARAESSRRTADRRYEQAKIKTEQTRRMVGFLRDIFESVDPYVAAGVDTSLLEQILEDARLQAATDLKQDPEVQAAVHDMLGVSFGLLNRVKESREELEEGLRLRRAHYGDVSEPVVESMLNLATLDFDAGRRDDSLARCREVQRLLEQLPNSSEELTARRLHVEASLAMGRSEFDRALKLSTEALDIRRRVLPEGDARTLRSEQDLGSALKLAGHFEEAERIFQSLLEEQTQRHGPDHPSVASALLSLGEIAIDRQQLEKAKEYLERSLKICRAAYRKPHLNTAGALSSLAALMNTMGRYTDGLSYAQEALDIRRELVGEDAPNNAASVLNVGTALKNLGRLAEAERYYNETLRLTENDGSRRLRATALNNLAALYKKQNKYEDSARLDTEALNLRKQLYPGNHPDVAQSLNNLAVSLKSLGRKEEAEALYRECLAMQTALYGTSSRTVARTCVNLSETILDRDPTNAEAFAIIKQSAETLERDTSTDDPTWLERSRFILACAMMANQQYPEAERVLRVCELGCRSGDSSRISPSSIYRRLADVCDKQGKAEEAANWREKLKSTKP